MADAEGTLQGNDRLPELERMRQALEASGRYRVLERLERRERYRDAAEGTELRTGLYVDVETTGLDPARDRIIELGLVAFEFDVDGAIYRILRELSAFEDPGRPIPAEITRLTGIDDAMVRGTRLPDAELVPWLESAHLVVAHNAGFDRPFLERRLPAFGDKAWACSAQDVPWREEGFEGRKLEYLAMKQGFVYDGHRATIDCRAGVHLLSLPLPASGRPALDRLLEGARRSDARLWAADSPFETKDALKARGYRWNGEARVWYRDLPREALEDEAAWLHAHVRRHPQGYPFVPINAFLRYSERVPAAPPADAARL